MRSNRQNRNRKIRQLQRTSRLMRRYGFETIMVPPRWLPGIITQKVGTCNYLVKVRGQMWKRHIDQLRLHHVTFLHTENIDIYVDFPTTTSVNKCNHLMNLKSSFIHKVGDILSTITDDLLINYVYKELKELVWMKLLCIYCNCM